MFLRNKNAKHNKYKKQRLQKHKIKRCKEMYKIIMEDANHNINITRTYTHKEKRDCERLRVLYSIYYKTNYTIKQIIKE